MEFKHPHKYGLMAMVAKEDYKFLEKYKKKLDKYVKFYMKPNFFDDIAPQHVSLCYFSYPEKYPEEFVKKLVPKINEITKNYLPLKLKIKGLLWGGELIGVPVILWNILDLGIINKFHNELIDALKKDIKHFNDPKIDFTPHIGVALIKKEYQEEVKKIINESRDDEEIELILDRLFIFYPKSPKQIFERV